MGLKKKLETYLQQTLSELDFTFDPAKVILEEPKNKAFGDWASNCAFLLAKEAKTSPADLAQKISAEISEKIEDLAEVSVSGPFINFKLKPAGLWSEILKISPEYGKNNFGAGQKVLIEFVSANPTGPLHIGHGRWAAIGDSLARILATSGFQVEKEFFINDVGQQVDLLAQSIKAVKDGQKIPEDGYHGSYLNELAREVTGGDLETIKKQAITFMVREQKFVLEKFRVKFDSWFSEERLHAAKEVPKVLKFLIDEGHTFQKDGAIWFKATSFGDEKDRVLLREDGRPTYFLSDIAYHWDKIGRGFDELINIWGADHHGYVNRLQAAMNCLPKKTVLKIIIGQLVSLYRGGEQVRMSKRTGEMVTLEEVIDEIGPDAGRYLLVRTSPNSHLDFDLELAKKHSDENPVFYVQYAHARISSIFVKQKEKKIPDKEPPKKLNYQFNEFEMSLMKKLVNWPDELEQAAQNLEPQLLPRYAEELANVFHVFYHNCQVLDEKELMATAVRLKLARVTKDVLAMVLGLLGVEAPERM